MHCFEENNDKQPSQGTWIDTIVIRNHALRAQPTD